MAWTTRMNLIKRWPLMYNRQEENISEHSHQTAVIAHLLTVILNVRYGKDLSPEKAATVAIYHELSETKLQDVNTNLKYSNPEFAKMFKEIEHTAEVECLFTLPEDLREVFEPLIIQKEVDQDYKRIVKAADILHAYVKTLNELRLHNEEFADAKINLEAKLVEQQELVPAVKDFLEVFLTNCTATLDKLCKSY